MLRQQLGVLSRLAATAWRLIDPEAPSPEPLAASTISASVRGLEKALRLQVRVMWAMRLIDALRAKLVAELQALENGQPPRLHPNPTSEARCFAAKPERAATHTAPDIMEPFERLERPERLVEHERLVERERFGFERRRSDADLAEILKRPTQEVLALICRELGLPDDWLRLAEEAWAREADDDDWIKPPCPSATGSGPSPPRRYAAPS